MRNSSVVMGPVSVYPDKHTGRQQTSWEDERTSEKQTSSFCSTPKGIYVCTPKYTPWEHVSKIPSLLFWRTTQGCLHQCILERAYSCQESTVVLCIPSACEHAQICSDTFCRESGVSFGSYPKQRPKEDSCSFTQTVHT